MSPTITIASDTNPPVISVIIPHFNMPDRLRVCLNSLLTQQFADGAVEIIVVDNGSRIAWDDVQRDYPQVRYLSEPKPGPGLARNTGVAASHAPLLAFIDADCIAAPGWLAAAYTGSAAGQLAGGDVQIGVRNPGEMTELEAFEAVFAFRQKLYIATRKFSGAGNLAMQRRFFDQVGPFGGIEMAEDEDWGRRACAQGMIFTYRPDMLVFHPARPDFAALARKWDRHIEHVWHDHCQQRRTMLRWLLLTLMVAGSPARDSFAVLFSNRLQGLGNRLHGIGVLWRIRWYRSMAMLAIARRPIGTTVSFWGR